MLQNRYFLLAIFCFLGFSSTSANDDTKKVKASLNEATVFFNGAELVHNASSAVVKGVNDIWITELSPNIDTNSLKIKTTKGVIIASHEYSLDFINKKEDSRTEKVLKDSVNFYKKQISEFEISTNTNNDLLELLKANKSIGGSQTGLNVIELSKMMEYYKTQSNVLNRTQKELGEKTEKSREALKRIESQLQQESIKNTKSMGILKLSLTSPITTTTDFTITYYTRSANWVPYYDINVPNTEEQIQIASKARVSQTTGLEWNKVKLALSTAAPSTNKEAPLFDAWFLDYKINMQTARGSLEKRELSQNSYIYGTLEKPAPSQQADNFFIRGMASSKDSDQALYVINGVPATESEVNELSPEMIDNFSVLKDASAIAMYGAQGANGVILVTTKTMTDFVKRDEGELNAVYNIDLPYTIEGNGKAQSIDLQNHSVSAEFKHYAIPKLDQEVFVLADISDWQRLGLLSGKANVTYDGTYVGETVINATSVALKLTLTLGTDRRITIKREKLQDFSSQKFLGRDTRQDFTYKITVKNNQSKAIKMVLKDQYPLSKQKDIQVELHKETTPTTHVNEEVGVLNWDFELGAGETKEFKVAYTVKYPKDSNINL